MCWALIMFNYSKKESLPFIMRWTVTIVGAARKMMDYTMLMMLQLFMINLLLFASNNITYNTKDVYEKILLPNVLYFSSTACRNINLT